jgi:hypothetical protein
MVYCFRRKLHHGDASCPSPKAQECVAAPAQPSARVAPRLRRPAAITRTFSRGGTATPRVRLGG